jgi:hypothetical protein
MKTLLLILSMAIAVPAISANAATPKQIAIATETCQEMEKQGALRVDRDARKAWVDPLLWIQMDAEQKELFTRMIATYASPEFPTITLYDKQSARELASYGQFQGFKVR